MENIGARRLHTIMTRLLDDILFDVPDVDHGEVVLDAEDVRERLQGIVQDTDLRKYICNGPLKLTNLCVVLRREPSGVHTSYASGPLSRTP
jgi:hypothetical protein